MIKYTIMLRACLMEHEGQNTFVKQTNTLEEAQRWIADQEGEYFRPSDYYITAPLSVGQDLCPRCHNLWQNCPCHLPDNKCDFYEGKCTRCGLVDKE
jgi:hypothetical protein